jgi:hypothetical protein
LFLMVLRWNLFSVAEIQWKAGFAMGTTEGGEVVVAFPLESFDHSTNEVRGDRGLRPDGVDEFRVSGFSLPRK